VLFLWAGFSAPVFAESVFADITHAEQQENKTESKEETKEKKRERKRLEKEQKRLKKQQEKERKKQEGKKEKQRLEKERQLKEQKEKAEQKQTRQPVPDWQVLQRASILSIGTPRLVPGRTAISWGDSIKLRGKSRVFPEVQKIARDAAFICQQQIQSKGYAVVPQDGLFQLYVTLVQAATLEENREILLSEVGLAPGLPGLDVDRDDIGKLSLILDLKQGRVSRWKGVTQLLLLPGSSEEMRNQRITHAVKQLLSTWPSSGGAM
jgi:hypothetical protein